MTRILLIDDLRGFLDDRDADVVRTSQAALDLFQGTPDIQYDEVWLDHDLGTFPGTEDVDDIMRVVDFFCERAFVDDNPVNVGVFYIHTSNSSGAGQMKTSLEHFGYSTRRVDAKNYLHQVVETPTDEN